MVVPALFDNVFMWPNMKSSTCGLRFEAISDCRYFLNFKLNDESKELGPY